VRLAVMIFLEIAVLASYLPLLSIHLQRSLGFGEAQVSSVFLARPLTSLVAPLVIGWLADRYVSSQILLGIVSLIRALSLVWLSQAHTYPEFLVAMSLMSFASWPSFVLMHSISFHHLTDPRQFGRVRVWGTISWVIAVWAVSEYMSGQGGVESQLAVSHHAFVLAAGLSALLAVYSFTLPDTPPARVAHSQDTLESGLGLLRDRNFAALALSGLLGAVAVPFVTVLLGLFFVERGTGLGLDLANANRAASVSQMLEIALFPLLGLSIARIGLRAVLFIGLFAWPLRFAACALGAPVWLPIGAQALHGFNFVFGITGTKIAVDMLAPKALRTSAQAWLATLVDGVGSAAGFVLCGAVFAHYALPGGGHDWAKIFLVPLTLSFGASIVFLVLFRGGPVPAQVAAAREPASR
jgi:MFS family permease